MSFPSHRNLPYLEQNNGPVLGGKDTNASYNIKQLVEADYVVQQRSKHDKRSVKVSLTEKGEELCKKLVEFNSTQAERLAGTKEATAQINATIDVLRNLENSWSEYLRYGAV